MTLKLSGKLYIPYETFLAEVPKYCSGIRNGRELIKTKELKSVNDFIFVKSQNGGYVESDGSSRKFDKVYIRKKLMDNLLAEPIYAKIGKAPPIIELQDTEQFKDKDGQICPIEVRGERTARNSYFLVSDISREFGIPNLRTNITDKRYNSFKEGIHYKYFICTDLESLQNKAIKKMYVSYYGLVHILFNSRSPQAEQFQMWAIETLFTIHMGSNESKLSLCSKLLGVNANIVKEVFNKSSQSLPCIYLFTLGHVKDLRKSMALSNLLNDDDIIAKYGFTNDLGRRANEHCQKFSKVPNANLCLKYYSYIDPQFVSDGESDIRELMNALKFGIQYESEKELVAIPVKSLKLIENEYVRIGKSYQGHITDIAQKLKDSETRYFILEKDSENHRLILENKIISQSKDFEMEKKDLKFRIYELEKENEILALRREIKISNTKKSK